MKFNTLIAALIVNTSIARGLGTIRFLIMRHYGKSFKTLATAAAVIGSGDLSHRVLENSIGELAERAQSFNLEVESLQKQAIPKAYLESLVDNNKDPLIVIDCFWHVTAANQAT